MLKGNNMLNQTYNDYTKIKTYNNVSGMTGKGEEWLVDDKGNPIAVFFYGQMQCQVFAIGDREATKAAG